MLENGQKDALHSTVPSSKKFMAKHWCAMAEADTKAIMKSIHGPGCVFLRQHLTPEGVDISELRAEIPVTWEFIRQLSKKKWKTEVQITTAFDHLSEAHAHMSSYAANMSSLAKIADPDTFQALLNGMAQPLIEVNIQECFLNPVMEQQPQTTAKECLEKLEKVLVPQAGAACLKREPSYGPTRLLVVALWLRLK